MGHVFILVSNGISKGSKREYDKNKGRVAQSGSLNNFCTQGGGDLIKELSHDGTTEERARTL
jgi:hypothetical protein